LAQLWDVEFTDYLFSYLLLFLFVTLLMSLLFDIVCVTVSTLSSESLRLHSDVWLYASTLDSVHVKSFYIALMGTHDVVWLLFLVLSYTTLNVET